MKTIFSTVLCLALAYSLFAQIGNKKVSSKNLGTIVSVKPVKIDLQNKTFPKGFEFKNLPELKVSEAKLKLPARRETKITPQRPYSPNLKLYFHGRYNEKYFLVLPEKRCSGTRECNVHHSFFNGTITFNAQRGKEYRLKIKLTNDRYRGKSYSDGEVLVNFNGSDHRVLVSRASGGEINIVFSAVQAGSIYFAFTGINPWPDGSSWHELAIESIQVDEI